MIDGIEIQKGPRGHKNSAYSRVQILLQNFARVAGLSALVACASPVDTPEEPGIRPPQFERVEVRAGLSWLNLQNETMGCEWLSAFDGLPELYLGFLYGSSGDSVQCLLIWLSDQRPKTLVAYLSNGVCIRKDNCSEREAITPNDIGTRAREVQMIVETHGVNTEIILVPQLEDNWGQEAAQEARRAVLASVGPGSRIYRNPVTAAQAGSRDESSFSGLVLHYDAFEESGEPPPPCVYSNDGWDISGIGSTWNIPHTAPITEVIKRARELPACIVLLWAADGNCLTQDTRDAPLPHLRNCEPNPEKIEILNRSLIKLQRGKR